MSRCLTPIWAGNPYEFSRSIKMKQAQNSSIGIQIPLKQNIFKFQILVFHIPSHNVKHIDPLLDGTCSWNYWQGVNCGVVILYLGDSGGSGRCGWRRSSSGTRTYLVWPNCLINFFLSFDSHCTAGQYLWKPPLSFIDQEKHHPLRWFQLAKESHSSWAWDPMWSQSHIFNHVIKVGNSIPILQLNSLHKYLWQIWQDIN